MKTVEGCPCVNTNCERHGNCAACYKHHNTNTPYPSFCLRSGNAVPKEMLDRVKEILWESGIVVSELGG